MCIPGKQRFGPGSLILVGLTVACVSCEDQTVGSAPTPDGAVDAAVVDAQVRTGPDAGACLVEEQVWQPRQWPIAAIEPYGENLPTRGRAFRVRVIREPLPPCHYPGAVQLDFYYEDNGYTDVGLRSNVWVLDASDCPEVPPDSAWIVPFFLQVDTNPTLRVRQVDFTGELTDLREVSFPTLPCPAGDDCRCLQTPVGEADPGEPCEYDCQCRRGSFCLPDLLYNPSGGRVCTRPCNSQHDCGSLELCVDHPSDETQRCEPAPEVTCSEHSDCPVGYQCITEAGRTNCLFGRSSGDDCCSDADCAVGMHCTTWSHYRMCSAWCLGNFGDRCWSCGAGQAILTLDCWP